MSTYLLDANVLIALVLAEHEHHDRAARWILDVEAFALCPVVQGSLVRFLLRLGETAGTATCWPRSTSRSAPCGPSRSS